jgi:parallel beta-helix repeat protein
MRPWPLLLAVLLAPFLAGPAEGALLYKGEQTLWADTVWSGEVLIDGILTVPPEITLEIRPGTVVRFSRLDSNGDDIGEHEIFIQGRLLAQGTAAQPILFTSAEARPRPGDWGAINMMAAEEENILTHCLVEYAYRGFHAHFARAQVRHCEFRRNVRGMQFQESTVHIEDCRIIDNLNGVQFRDAQVTLQGTLIRGNYWGLRCVYSEVEVHHCRIEGNLINGLNLRDSTLLATGNLIRGNRRGLYLQRSTGEVSGNHLLANSEHGIFLEESNCRVFDNRISGNGRAGVRWVDSHGQLRGNDLSGNGQYALVNDGESGVDARGNWWGTMEETSLAGTVRDGRQRDGRGPVAMDEWLVAPPPWRQRAEPGSSPLHSP